MSRFVGSAACAFTMDAIACLSSSFSACTIPSMRHDYATCISFPIAASKGGLQSSPFLYSSWPSSKGSPWTRRGWSWRRRSSCPAASTSPGPRSRSALQPPPTRRNGAGPGPLGKVLRPGNIRPSVEVLKVACPLPSMLSFSSNPAGPRLVLPRHHRGLLLLPLHKLLVHDLQLPKLSLTRSSELGLPKLGSSPSPSSPQRPRVVQEVLLHLARVLDVCCCPPASLGLLILWEPPFAAPTGGTWHGRLCCFGSTVSGPFPQRPSCGLWALLPKSCEIWLHGQLVAALPRASPLPSSSTRSSAAHPPVHEAAGPRSPVPGPRPAKTCLADVRPPPEPTPAATRATPCTAMATVRRWRRRRRPQVATKNLRSGPFRHPKGPRARAWARRPPARAAAAAAVDRFAQPRPCLNPASLRPLDSASSRAARASPALLVGPTKKRAGWARRGTSARARTREGAKNEAGGCAGAWFGWGWETWRTAHLACRGMLPGATVGAFPIRSASFSGLKGWFGPMAKGMGGAFRGCCPCAAESYPFPARN